MRAKHAATMRVPRRHGRHPVGAEQPKDERPDELFANDACAIIKTEQYFVSERSLQMEERMMHSICIGLCLGIAVSVAMDIQIGIGIGIGVLLGFIVGHSRRGDNLDDL